MEIQVDSKLLSGVSWPVISKHKVLTEYESVTQEVLFDNAVLAALMSERKYDVIPQNGDCSRESNVRTLVFRNKVRYQNAASLQNSIWKAPPSDDAIRRSLKQLQETGHVLHRRGAGRPCSKRKDIGRIQEACTSYVQRKAGMLKLFSIPQY
jgi:hypothetical protein